MHEPVATREDIDEGAEVHELRDAAVVDGADLDVGRDLLDSPPRLEARRGVDRRDLHGAVVTHVDRGAGFLGQRPDDAASLPDDVANLLRVNLERDDPRREHRHVRPRRPEGRIHPLENVQPALARLDEGGFHDFPGDSVDLDVHLQRGHALAGTRDLEVHVAEMILVAHDVGEHDERVTLLDEPHRDSGNRRRHRHTSVHQREAGTAHRRHRARSVRFRHFRNHPHDIREVVHVRHDRLNGPLRQPSMPYLAATRSKHPPSLADAERREVVVQHEGLAALALDSVDDLGISGRAEGSGDDGLGFAAREQGGAVRPGQELHATRNFAHHRRATAVDAALSRNDGTAHDRLLELVERLAHLALGPAAVLLADQRLDCRVADLANQCPTLDLVDDSIRLPDSGFRVRADGLVERFVPARRLQFPPRLSRLRGKRLNRVDDGLDLLMTEHHCIEHYRLGKHVRLRLDHQHRAPGSRDDELQVRRRGLLEGRIENELLSDVADARRPHRAVERQSRHRDRGRCSDQGRDVRIDLGIEREHGGDHLHLVSKPVGKQRAQRAVDETRRQRLLFRRPSFALEEAAGNLARGIRLLDVVHRQRKEISARLRRPRTYDGRQHSGIAEAREHRARRLASDFARFQYELTRAERNRLLDGCHWLNLAMRGGAPGRGARHTSGG